MTMINQNFTMYAGDTKPIVVDVTKPDGSPVDLLGATIKWGLRANENSITNLILKQTTGGITVVSNQMTINLLPNDTKLLSGKYVHECEVTDQQGNVSTIFVGKATIKLSGV